MKLLNSSFPAIFIVFCFGICSHADAQITNWTNSSGGDFHNSSNWDNGVPTASDFAYFNLADTYTVDLTADATVQSILSLNGDVRFIGGNTLSTSSTGPINILNTLSCDGAGTKLDSAGLIRLQADNSRLNIIGGAEVSSVGGQIGWGSGTDTKVTISGTGSIWNNSSFLTLGPTPNEEARVDVLDGGVLNAAYTQVGNFANSSGFIDLADTGSQFNSTSTVVIGVAGDGRFDVRNGADATSQSLFLGEVAGGVGTLNISGEGSSWVNNGSLTVGYSGNGNLNVTDGGLFSTTNASITSQEDSSGNISVAGINSGGTRSTFTTNNLFVGSTNLGSSGTFSNDIRGVVLVGNDTATNAAVGELTIGSDSSTATLRVHKDSTFSNSSRMFIGKTAGFTGNVIVQGDGARFDNSNSQNYIGYRGSGTLTIQDGGLATNLNATVGHISGSTGSVSVSGTDSRWEITNDLQVARLGAGSLAIDSRGVVSTKDLTVGLSATGNVSISGFGSKLEVTDELDVRNGTINIETGSSVTVGFQTNINSSGSVELDGGAFHFGLIDADSYSRISGTSGTLIGGIRVDGYNEISSLSGDYSITNLNTEQVGIGNAGVIHGSGNTTLSLHNSELGEVRTNSGQWTRFGGIFSTNAGQMNVFSNGSLEFEGHVENTGGSVNLFGGSFLARGIIANSEGSMIAGRGQVISRLGIQNEGAIATSGGNMDILGDFQNLGDGTVVTSGNSTTTFFDDVIHNGAEIRTSTGSSTVFLGSFSGAGDFTGAGDVYFEGDLRPGNSPDVVSFAGNILLGESTDTLIELAGLGIGEFDRLEIAGDLHLDGMLSVELIDGFQLDLGQEFLIMDVDGALSGTFTGLDEGDLIGTFGEQELYVTYSAGDGNDVAVFTAAVPEPNSLALLGLLGLAAIANRRKK